MAITSPTINGGSHLQKGQNLTLAALGVVFGDIGTSPLYTLKECFGHAYGIAPTQGNILGILSLIFWAIMSVVSLKYVVFIMRADNKGEGGIMALMSLVSKRAKISGSAQYGFMILGLIGASLFYGDGIITPAISVLSAVEGLEVLKPELHESIIPISLAVLVLLFVTQRHGTHKVGQLFGPIMVIWFLVLAIFGIRSLLLNPMVLSALNPLYAYEFFVLHHWHGFFALAGVVLAITGGEALYADMGHFGRIPISRAWFLIALPALLLNYFGQGALLLRDASAIENPFYLIVPPEALKYTIILATLSTVIASQAVISGAFSLTAQAIQLGFVPRLLVKYTSEGEMGQIYLPGINWALMVGVLALIIGFQSSSALAGAYGIAVTGTMVTTTILASVVFRRLWKWNLLVCVTFGISFMVVDLAFLAANAMKIFDGGWFPILVGAIVFVLLTTWKFGRTELLERLKESSMQLGELKDELLEDPPSRAKGTAIFMSRNTSGIPLPLSLNFQFNKVLHETVVLVSVITDPVPRVAPEKRREITVLTDSIFRLNLHYGFMETPNIPKSLGTGVREFSIDPKNVYYFLNRETLIVRPDGFIRWLRLKLFILMARNAGSAAEYFQIPHNRVVEIGTQVAL